MSFRHHLTLRRNAGIHFSVFFLFFSRSFHFPSSCVPLLAAGYCWVVFYSTDFTCRTMHQVKTHQRLLMKNNPNSSKMCTEHHTSFDTQQLAGWLLSARFARIASSMSHTASSMWHPASSHGAGNAEVADELESQADNEVPDVAGDLGASDECTPQDDGNQGVEDVTDVAKSAHPKEKVWG